MCPPLRTQLLAAPITWWDSSTNRKLHFPAKLIDNRPPAHTALTSPSSKLSPHQPFPHNSIRAGVGTESWGHIIEYNHTAVNSFATISASVERGPSSVRNRRRLWPKSN